MSEAQEDPTLLAGHAPAVKVGGMRVVHHKKHPEKAEEPETKEEQEEFEVPAKVDKHHQQILLSGAVTKGDKDFPEAAVKAIHEKPHQSHENKQARNVHTQGPKMIQQPRKQ